MIAEGRAKLKSIWPGYDFNIVAEAAELQLRDIKQAIVQAL
jgi:hypothetical protein